MDLYFSAISAYSHKTKMAFYEKEVKFNPMLVNLANENQRGSFRELYPLGKLPCLHANGEWIGESTNIIEWLDTHYQTNKLIPEKPELARQARYWDRIADLYITANAVLLFFQGVKPEAKQDPERIAIAKRQIAVAYGMLEKTLHNQGKLIGGGVEVSLAEISVGCGLVVSQNFVALNEFPGVANLLKQISARPSFEAAREGFEDAVGEMVAALNKAA